MKRVPSKPPAKIKMLPQSPIGMSIAQTPVKHKPSRIKKSVNGKL